MNKNIFLLIVTSLLFLSSCKPREKASEINYMQNVEQLATDVAAQNVSSSIQIGDQLSIFVSAKNMEVVRPFNQSYYTTQTPVSSSNPNTSKIYLVDSEGNIDFPILGKLNTTNKTLEAFKNEIQNRVSYYVKNPNVTINVANFKVTLLGEVNRPGQYEIPEGQTTILKAIGMAGDLTIYGKREDVLLVRQENGVIIRQRLNLMDVNFINSPYFNLKQGDVIYISANQTKEKVARQDPNTGIYMAVAGTIIGLAGIFITIFKN